MKILIEAGKEKAQLLGHDKRNIFKIDIHQKVQNLLSLRTRKEFQHQLANTTKAIVEVCI